MQSKEKNNIIFLRLFPEEDLNEELQKTCLKYDIKTAIVISGIGQLKKAEIGYFKKKGNYYPETFSQPLEILSLTGNIFKEKDNYYSHLHIVLSDEDKKTYGGHFIKGQVSITAEIVLLKSDIEIFRKLDDKTGLQALILE